MRDRIRMVDVELDAPPADINGLRGYTGLRALACLHGAPLGYIDLPVTGDCCRAADLRDAILSKHGWAIMRHLLVDALDTFHATGRLSATDLIHVAHGNPQRDDSALPLITVAVCTRDRPDDLRLCLEALRQLNYPRSALDLLVVDNAAATSATETLVHGILPEARYVREPRPGLDWARNRAIQEARGALIAFTDDDVIVDPGWLRAIAEGFVDDPDVMAITGLVVPWELETEAQHLFELYGGFGRGFERRWRRYDRQDPDPANAPYGAGRYGTGANMAFRRALFDAIGPFDPALDVGTLTNGGGDLELFFRALKEGYTLLYEPRAIVRHRHRRTMEQLGAQIANNGIGFYAYLTRATRYYPDERWKIARFGVWWFRWWNLRRLAQSFLRPTRLPRALILAELRGSLVGPRRYAWHTDALARRAGHWRYQLTKRGKRQEGEKRTSNEATAQTRVWCAHD